MYMQRPVSLSHWGLFEQQGPIILMPIADDEPLDIRPGMIFRVLPDQRLIDVQMTSSLRCAK
jgi:hypothetical protein